MMEDALKNDFYVIKLSDKNDLIKLRGFYNDFLFKNIVPFWMEKGLDNKHGGIYTCLDQKGEIYNTDKSVWFQGRAAWLFSKLCNSCEKRPEWLEAAEQIYRFMVENCFDSDGRMFFTVTEDGRPIQKRRYMYSEAFAVIAFAEYAKASRNEQALMKARQIYAMMIDLYRHPEKTSPKINPETRKTRSLAVPMILLGTAQVLRDVDVGNDYGGLTKGFADTILNDFYKPDERALFENIGESGQRLDSPQGRCINPGHAIEACWFIMHEGIRSKDGRITEKALKILSDMLELGWDKKFGGLFYFLDIEGKPPEQLEWDMKLWWPATEAIYAALLAYNLSGDDKYAKWFSLINSWAFSHFGDGENGEWFGYLHRDGTLSNTLKGSLWKGPFHLPRALLMCIEALDEMIEKN